jgi:hypothetical protein
MIRINTANIQARGFEPKGIHRFLLAQVVDEVTGCIMISRGSQKAINF